MENGRPLLKWAGIIAAFTIVATYGIDAQGVQAPAPNSNQYRADILAIDALKAFGRLERPPVTFLHDLHTSTLEKKGKDCQACHQPMADKDRLSVKFMRLEDTSRKALMEIYHTNCIGCHTDFLAAKEKGGPITCGECHQEASTVLSARQPMGLDRSLHFRHTKVQEDKCERCHHEYDEKAQKLVYTKGKEGTCRYCHKAQSEEKRISYRLAAHGACIDCHRKTMAQNKQAGPEHCSGCHALSAQQKIEKVAEIPRMQMKQPDIVLVKTEKSAEAGNTEVEDRDNPGSEAQSGLAAKMNRVPFNHKEHEQYNDTCRVCHHSSLSACAECHTTTGSQDGNFIKIGQSMHQAGTETSCVGCHNTQQSDKNCAGCHAHMLKDRSDQTACLNCHMPLPQTTAQPIPPDQEKRVAEALLVARTPVTETYSDEDIPEKVSIAGLVDRYEPAELPHRKIVQTLVNNIKDHKLATYLHPDKGTVCQGCHHHTPIAKKPPLCGSCHGKPFDDKQLFMPGLMAAYHGQCMGCHDAMELEKPAKLDCTACHKERKKG